MKITQDLLKELLHYDADTGVFTWRERGIQHFKTELAFKTWNTRFAGKRAGSITTNKYGYQLRSIRINQKHFYEHRLAWLYATGEMPKDQIDHINRDARDNRLCNLRESSNKSNARNQSLRSTNTSGVTGVSWNNRRGVWEAHCTHDGKKHNLGYFTEIDEAAMEALEFRAERGFSREHGLEIAHYHAGAIA